MRITTLVPAYKSKYLMELLTAMRQQTVKPARILFSDDSPNQDFVAQLNEPAVKNALADLHIEVIPGQRNGAWNNFLHLLKQYAGQTELFHIWLDDDICYPSFYERHLQAHGSGQVHCVVSRRWTALENGQPLRELPVPLAVAQHPQRTLALEAGALFASTAAVSGNWLGEFSNATFSAAMVPDIEASTLGGLSFAGLEDLGAFLMASLRGPIGYINEPLGYFRTSGEQHSANPYGRPLKLAHFAYLALALGGWRVGRLSEAQALACLANLCPTIVQRYGQEADVQELIATMAELPSATPEAQRAFIGAWHRYAGLSVPVPAALPEDLAVPA